MMSNKKFILTSIIILLLIVTSTIVNSLLNYKTYEESILKNNAFIIHNLIQQHPELETDIITSMIDQPKKIDMKTLAQYGIDKSTISYITDNKLKSDMVQSNLTIVVIGSSLLFGVLYLYTRQENKKLTEINNYMNEILNNNYSLDIRDYDEGYLSHLKNDIYKMTVKLKEANDLSLKDKKMLEETLSDISHQLKTPLTSMYVLNELLGQDLTKTRRQELLAKNYNQLTRIEWLVTSLLKISMLDSGTVQLIKKPVKLKDIISKALESLIIPIELKEVKLEIECNPKIKAKLDFNWTVESFMNIIKNAYEHTNSGGTITIKVQDNPIYVEVRIMDTGEGINENDINHIFERFYKSKSSGKDSIGIGLNMAKKIIDLESGDIRANSKLKLGSEFTIKFYKN